MRASVWAHTVCGDGDRRASISTVVCLSCTVEANIVCGDCACVDRCVYRIQSRPTSFVVIVPAWTDERSHEMMKESRFCKRHIVLEKSQHSYRAGGQHVALQQVLYTLNPNPKP